jgi:sugar-specific transcriptional regulator TrmB
MIPKKAKDHLDEYINQEVYVQIAIIKGKEKISTEAAIYKYFNSNHFKDLSEGRPYDHFIEGLRDKCLGKLKNSPMKDKQTDDETIKELQNKLNNLSDSELDNTFWEIETGEFFSSNQIKELENNRNDLIKKLNLSKNEIEVYETILSFCKSYEKLCQKKYPEAPLPLELLKSIN